MIETNIVCDVIVEKSFAIKAIDRKTVHRICSGQVTTRNKIICTENETYSNL